MEPVIIAVVVAVMIGLLALIASEMPIAFALAAAGGLGLLVLRGSDNAGSTLATTPYDATASYSLIVIPLFIVMGILAFQAGIAEDVFAVAHNLTKRLPGGLAIATMVSCGGFAAITGSSVAMVATMGRVAVPAMRRLGYKLGVAAGVVATGGTLGVLIPPSVVLVVYGALTQQSIGQLLLAGYIPGLVSLAVYCIGIALLARIGAMGDASSVPSQPPEAPGENLPNHPSTSRYVSVLYIVIITVIIIGGINSGIFTATESAAVAALVALIMALVRFRRQRGGLINGLRNAFEESASLTSMIFALLVGGSIFGLFLINAGVPTSLTQWVLNANLPPQLVVAAILLAMVPLGMFLDGLTILVVVVPIAYPIVTDLGFDGLWFGILIVKMIELGMITPPVGINIYTVAGVVDGLDAETAFRGVAPFWIMEAITITILFFMPQLVTWLPSLAAG